MAKAPSKTSNIAMRRQQALASGDPEYQKRRDQLFAAAGEVFRQKGYDGASISDFANAIGIDRASIYYYTSGKEELFQQLVQNATAENVAMVEQVLDSDLDPEEKLRTFIIELLKSYERHYPYMFLFIQEDMARISSRNSAWAKEVRALSQRFDSAVLRIIEEAVQAGRVDARVASPKTISLAIVGMCNWSHRWFRPDGKATAEQIGRAFSSIVLQGILAEPGATP